MAVANKKYLCSEEEIARVESELRAMVADQGLHTGSSYSPNADTYPDNVVSFVQKHMAYLNDRPRLDPDQYLSNLRLMIKIR